MNFEPNQEQVKSTVRWLIATFGPFIISHGYATSSNLELYGGIIVSIVPFIWGMFVHKQSNAVAVVNAMSDVKGVVTQPTVGGRALAEAVFESSPAAAQTVVPAGTVKASEMARS